METTKWRAYENIEEFEIRRLLNELNKKDGEIEIL